MRKDFLTVGAIIALTLIFAPAARGQEVKTAQETKPAQASDNRAQALKKYLEAQRLEQSGNFPGAVAAYKEAITLDPQSAELRVAFGSLYLKSRNVIDAEAQAREAMKVAPDNPEVHKLLARVYLAQTFVGTTLDKEKARAAIKELEEVARLNSTAKIEVGSQEVAVYTLIGELYWSLDEEDKALDALKRVAESDGTADKAHFQLAQLYYQKNKFREAAAAARKAYDLNQKSPDYAGLLAKSLCA